MPDSRLTADQTSVRRKAREFAQREILPVAWYYDEQDYIPLDILKKAFEADIISADIPAQYGGKGYRLLDIVMMIEEIAAACPGIAMSIFDNSLSIAPLMLSRNEGLKARCLTDIASSFKLICFAASEPVVADSAAGCRCRAEAEGDGFILNGTIYSVINGAIADYMCVFADTKTSGVSKGVGAFLVDLASPGVSVSRPTPRLGQRCSHAAGIAFRDVFVAASGMMAEPGEGRELAVKAFNRIRPMIAAYAVGTARAAMEFAADHADRHRDVGTPGADIETIETRLDGMQKKVVAARLLTWKSAWELDEGRNGALRPSMARIYGMAWDLANDAMQIFGGYGGTHAMAAEKLFRDIRLLRIYENICEIQRIILAGAVMDNSGRLHLSARDSVGERKRDLVVSPDGLLRWHCRTCGNVYYGKKPHTACPYCFFPKKIFSEVPADPGRRDIEYHDMAKGKDKQACRSLIHHKEQRKTKEV